MGESRRALLNSTKAMAGSQIDVIEAYLKENDLQGKVSEAVTKCVQMDPRPDNVDKFLAEHFAAKAGLSFGAAPAGGASAAAADPCVSAAINASGSTTASVENGK